MMEHDFIEVLNRRWCLNCDTFQTKRNGQWPKQTKDCAMDTPRARSKWTGDDDYKGDDGAIS
jgi:hypothetical protein